MIDEVLPQGAPTQDTVAEGQAVGTGAAAFLKACEDPAADGFDVPEVREAAGVTRRISSTFQRLDDPPDFLLVLWSQLHDLSLLNRNAATLSIEYSP
jgi:hypothetical protein